MEFEREVVADLVKGLREMPQLLHIVIGPRQVGKTTAVRQVAERLGWPRVVASADDESLCRRYVTDSLVEAVLARDVMTGHRIAKPVLLRHLFALACAYPSQVVSYNKMLGQLVDAGNTTTLAGYVEALQTAFLLSGLQAWSGSAVRQRASSPKLVLWNNALIHAMSRRTAEDVRADAAWRGRLVENAVGAHLLCHFPTMGCSVHYWREGNAEVDFVVARPGKVWALEVKSGRGGKTPGMPAFRKRFPEAEALLIGGGGVPLEDFFHHHPGVWFGK